MYCVVPYRCSCVAGQNQCVWYYFMWQGLPPGDCQWIIPKSFWCGKFLIYRVCKSRRKWATSGERHVTSRVRHSVQFTQSVLPAQSFPAPTLYNMGREAEKWAFFRLTGGCSHRWSKFFPWLLLLVSWAIMEGPQIWEILPCSPRDLHTLHTLFLVSCFHPATLDLMAREEC